MPQVQHILVPVEIHENAMQVVAWAVLLARALRSHLTLLHVDESLESLKHRSVAMGKAIPGTAQFCLIVGIQIESQRRIYHV